MKSLKFVALTLGTCAAALFAPTYDARAEAFTAEQTAEIEALFKKFLVENPETILESVDRYRAEQEQKTQQSAEENLAEYADFFKTANLPMAGNPDGDVTVVEYFDYNCGYCRKAFEDIQVLLKEDKNLRVVFQEMPILSPSSKKMTGFALAAHEQGRYFDMHKALMDYKGTQSDDAYYGIMEKLGLDLEKIKADAASDAVQTNITKTLDMARVLGIRGTPGFIVGDKIYPGYIGLDGLRDAIKEARAASEK